MNQLPEALAQEIRSNMEGLRRDLDSINNPQNVVDDFAEGYSFEAFRAHITQPDVDHTEWEILTGFYRSIEVLQTGHPNLLSAEESELEHAYRTLIESALGFGEELIGSED